MNVIISDDTLRRQMLNVFLIYDNFAHHTAGSTLHFTATQNFLSHRLSVGGLRRLSTGWI